MQQYTGLIAGAALVLGLLAGVYLTNTFKPQQQQQDCKGKLTVEACKANVVKYTKDVAKQADANCKEKLAALAQSVPKDAEETITGGEEPPIIDIGTDPQPQGD